jgi:hypothetical protein
MGRAPRDHAAGMIHRLIFTTWRPAVVVIAVCMAVPLEAGQDGSPEPPASPLERALMEHVCGPERPAAAQNSDVHDACLQGQLRLLRTDFGMDLQRLSPSDRKGIDAACNAIRTDRGRDAYVRCLSDRLAAVRDRMKADRSVDSAAPDSTPVAGSEPAAPAAVPASSSSKAIWIGGGLVAALALSGGLFVVLKTRARPARTACRACGAELQGGGDLCQKCRREAAETVRRAAAERTQAAGLEKARAEEPTLEAEQQRESFRRQQEALRAQQEALLAQQEALRAQQEISRREEEERLQREEQEWPAEGENEFDPHAVLGISKDAASDEIHAAYETARLKYHPDEVSHLGADLQAHFKAKAEAVERAFKMLTEP